MISSTDTSSSILFDDNNMNVGENHLSGYIKSDSGLAPSGLDVRHGDPATWSPALWRWAVSALNIKSVLDVGCGEGHGAAFFNSLGCDILGIDGSSAALRDSQIPQHHVQHDFTRSAFDPGRSFDLVWSCEFVEHVDERYSADFLTTFSCASRFVMMTHALPGQPGWNHVNCQHQGYWEMKLSRAGFLLNQPLTAQARLVARSGHFSTTGLVFQKDRG